MLFTEFLMRKIFLTVVSLMLSLCLTTGVLANEAVIKKRLAQLFPDEKATTIAETAVPGLYEVVFGTSVFYLSGDGKFAFHGDLIDIENGVNLSNRTRRAEKKKIADAVFSDLDDSETILFADKDAGIKQTLYVFTDIKCGYCRKFHQDVPKLNKAGIAVRYFAYPLLAKDSATKLEAVWCSKDRQRAITEAKAGKKVKSTKCSNAVSEHHALGRKLGIDGTPAIFTADGRQLGGYIPADDLIKELN